VATVPAIRTGAPAILRPTWMAGDATERGMIAAGDLGGVDNSFSRGAPVGKTH